jgi:hypothetical protein
MGTGARKALDDLRMSWPKGTDKRYADMLDFLDKAEVERKQNAAVAGPLPSSPADVEAKVMEILESYRGVSSTQSPDPRETQIIKLGRLAIGALVRALTEDAYGEEWAMRQAAKRGLTALVEGQDAPMLAKLVREGHVEVEAAFENLDSPAAVAAFAGLIKEGRFGTDLDVAAKPHLREPAIVAACCAWLDKPVFEGDMDFAIAEMADLVGGGDRAEHLPPGFPSSLGGDAAMKEALPALVRLLDRPLRIDPHRRVASAVVRLGGKAGIPALIDVLTADVQQRFTDTNYERHAAGQQLNHVSGTQIYVGHDVHDPNVGFTTWEGNFAEAAKAFRAWWDKSKDHLHFDPATRTWSVN